MLSLRESGQVREVGPMGGEIGKGVVVCGCETPPGVSLRSRGDVDRAGKGQPFSMQRACGERERGKFHRQRGEAIGKWPGFSCLAVLLFGLRMETVPRRVSSADVAWLTYVSTQLWAKACQSHDRIARTRILRLHPIHSGRTDWVSSLVAHFSTEPPSAL